MWDDAGGAALTVGVFPMAWLSFGEPRDGRLDPLLARRFAFRFGDPLEVFLFVAVAEIIECCPGFFVFRQRRHEIIRHDELLFDFGSRWRGLLDAGFVKLRGLPEVADQNLVPWQIGKLGKPTEMSHPSILCTA